MANHTYFDAKGKQVIANRPEPVFPPSEIFAFTKRTDPDEAVEALRNDQYVLIKDFFSSGLYLLKEIKAYLSEIENGESFQDQQDFRKLYRKLSHKVLLQIRNHQLVVRKSPEIGWLAILYPDHQEFYLPFPQLQGLNSAWQWYVKGVKIPGLRDAIHPFYGTYFPTRFEHISLFETWLKTYAGKKGIAIDVGTGSGVLSLLLWKHRFEKVIGTDHNPNAIIGFQAWMARHKNQWNIELYHGDLFAGSNEKADVILFNPPWIPLLRNAEGLDTAIYYDDQLFPRFFEEAKKHLQVDGRLIVLFSNLAEITNVTTSHPVRLELTSGNRFELESLHHQKVKEASTKTRRNQSWRKEEQVELWVLKPNS